MWVTRPLNHCTGGASTERGAPSGGRATRIRRDGRRAPPANLGGGARVDRRGYLRCVTSVTSLPARLATFAFLSARFSLSVFVAAVLLDDFFGDLSDTVTPFGRGPGRPRARNTSAGACETPSRRAWRSVAHGLRGRGRRR